MKKIVFFLLSLLACSQIWGQKRHGAGLIFDDEAYEAEDISVPLIRDITGAKIPSRASLKVFAPDPGDQFQYNNCVGWSSAYAARSILFNSANNVRSRSQINANAFSPAFTYRLISKDQECYTPTSIEHALKSMAQTGAVFKRNFDNNCSGQITTNLKRQAEAYKIANHSRIFYLKDNENLKIAAVKNAIAEGKPVIIGMKCPPSFEHADGQLVWNRKESLNTQNFFGHAMCVVSYDNQKYGGAFEIMNSWGKNWGTGGFIWVRYEDFGHFTKYAYVPLDKNEVGPLASNRPSVPSSRPIRPKQQQLGQASPNVFDLSGTIRMVQSNGREMPARLYGNMYRSKMAYRSGTEFRIYIETSQPAYVYALGSDLSKKTFRIFPATAGQNAYMDGRGSEIAIPDRQHFIKMDQNAGQDYLCVIYSKKELNLDQIRRQIETSRGSFTQRVAQVLGDAQVNAKNIQYNSSDIGFSAISESRSLVYLIVETEHTR